MCQNKLIYSHFKVVWNAGLDDIGKYDICHRSVHEEDFLRLILSNGLFQSAPGQ